MKIEKLQANCRTYRSSEFFLAVPIFCGAIDGSTDKTAIQIIAEDMWREKCKNVSGIEVDFDRNDRLHLAFSNCKENAVDNDQLRQDIVPIFPNLNFDSIPNFTLSDRQKADIVAVTQKCVLYVLALSHSLRY